MQKKRIRNAGDTCLNSVCVLLVLSILDFSGHNATSQDGRSKNLEDAGKDTYSQRLTIQFQDAETAKLADVRLEPLFDGHHRAVSCRWDDNWTSDNPKTRDLMEECGIKGTWYLNGRQFSPENRPADYLPVAKKLLRGGNSVGGHSLTHPFITYFHSNRMFAEMSGVRIVWESALDRPVLSYAYSFVDVKPGPEHHDVLRRTLDSLTRSGFDHVAEYISFFDDVKMHQELSPIMPPENNPFEAFRSAVDWAYNDAKLTKNYPMITNSMHAWYGTPRLKFGYDELRRRFELLTALKDVWHCNQNQFAGYRRQFRNTKIGELKRTGKTISFTLTRPGVLAMNDDTPLTIAVLGVEKDAIKSIECPNCKVLMSQRKESDRIRFHVPHRLSERLPERIGHIANPENASTLDRLKRDQDFPQIEGGLFANGKTLKLLLRCEGDRPLEDVRIVWRMPLGYNSKQNTQHLEQAIGNQLEINKNLIASMNPDSRWGREHFAAQVDFRYMGKAGRLHLTCQRPGSEPDNSLPREGFSILGPIDPKRVTVDEIQRIAKAEWSKRRWEGEKWKLSGKTEMAWRKNARDGYVNQAWLNPEYVRTMGTWDAVSSTYVLRSTIWSNKKRQTRITISHPKIARVLVNGRQVGSEEVQLDKGENKILVIYPGCTLGVATQRLTACFLRLSDPQTGIRIRDIRYRAF